MHRWLKIAAAATTVGGLALFGAGAPAAPPDGPLELAANGGRNLIVTGTPVRNLHPNAVRRIWVSFTNPNRFRIQVVEVKAKLTATSKRGCRVTPANLQIGRYHGLLPARVPPRSRRGGGYVEVRMPNSVSPACQRAAFSIKLVGRAKEARR